MLNCNAKISPCPAAHMAMLWSRGGNGISANPFEFIGKTHNAGLVASIKNFGYLDSNSLKDYYDFEKNFILAAIPQFRGSYPTFEKFLSLQRVFNSQYTNDPIEYMHILLMTERVSEVFYKYWILNYSTLFLLNDFFSIKRYYSSLVNIILNANDIKLLDKNLILQSSSLNVYSYIFYLCNANR